MKAPDVRPVSILAEGLFRAFFCESADLEDRKVLVEIAAQAGMDAGEVTAMLHSDQAAAAVRRQLKRARELEISGVPSYRFPNGYLLPGAQSSDVMAQIITRVREKLNA